MRKVMLDTNAYSILLKGDKRVLLAINAADRIYLSMIVFGELLAGFRKGSREKRNRMILNEFLGEREVLVLDVTRESADGFAQVGYDLSKKGTPIPKNDMWIAAQAIEVDATLVTYDSHFLDVPGLRVWEGLRSL